VLVVPASGEDDVAVPEGGGVAALGGVGVVVPEVGGVAVSAGGCVGVLLEGGVTAVASVGAGEPLGGVDALPLEGGAMIWVDGDAVLSGWLPDDLCQQPVKASGRIMTLRKAGFAGLFIIVVSAMQSTLYPQGNIAFWQLRK
jgi:hypothetical protein